MNPRELRSGPLVWIGIILTTCLLLVLFQSVLWLVMPILLAIVIYYIVSPLVFLVMRKGWTRLPAVLIVTVFISAVLILVALLLALQVARFSIDWRQKLEEYGASGAQLAVDMETTLAHYVFVLHWPVLHPDEIKDRVAAWTSYYSSDIALDLLHWIPSLLLIPYFTYFFLLDGPRFKRFLVQAIPNAFFEKTLYLFYRVEEQLRRYLQGVLLLTALDGACLATGFALLGLNGPLLLAFVAAVLAWLPYLGSIAGCALVVIVAKHDVPQSHWLPYEAIALFVAVRLLDDFAFLPMTVGRSLRLHPLVTILMILLGGAVAGISGLLLVMPVLGVVTVVGQIVGELVTDDRIRARYRHTRALHRARAQIDLALSE